MCGSKRGSEYVGMELKRVGMAKSLLAQGSALKIITAPFSRLKEHMFAKALAQPVTMIEVKQYLKGLTQTESEGVLPTCPLMHTVLQYGDVLVVPAGWLVSEKMTSPISCGVQLTVAAPGFGSIESLQDLLAMSPDNPHPRQKPVLDSIGAILQLLQAAGPPPKSMPLVIGDVDGDAGVGASGFRPAAINNDDGGVAPAQESQSESSPAASALQAADVAAEGSAPDAVEDAQAGASLNAGDACNLGEGEDKKEDGTHGKLGNNGDDKLAFELEQSREDKSSTDIDVVMDVAVVQEAASIDADEDKDSVVDSGGHALVARMKSAAKAKDAGKKGSAEPKTPGRGGKGKRR